MALVSQTTIWSGKGMVRCLQTAHSTRAEKRRQLKPKIPLTTPPLSLHAGKKSVIPVEEAILTGLPGCT